MNDQVIKIMGTSLSPWVRRVLICLEERHIPYQHVPLIPASLGGEANEEFDRVSPLGKIPAMIAGTVNLADSLAICAFLDGQHDQKKLIPQDPENMATMLWVCEYISSGLFSKSEATIFFERVVKPINGATPNEAEVATALEALPRHLSYLEQLLNNDGYFVTDELTLAEFTLGSVLLNLYHAGVTIDQADYPRMNKLREPLFARESFQKIITEEMNMLGAISKLDSSLKSQR
jgi:glutathione S-transferase